METFNMAVDVLTLTAEKSTWGKASIKQSTALLDSEKVYIAAGSSLRVLADYGNAADGHIRVTTESPTAIGSTLYLHTAAFPSCPEVLRVNGSIRLRAGKLDAVLQRGSCLELVSLKDADPIGGRNYADIEFRNAVEGRTDWQTFHSELHKCTLIGTSPTNRPIGVAGVTIPKAEADASITLPWFTSPESGNRARNVSLKAAIIPGGHFTWAEATKGGSRIPDSESTVNGIIRIARAMEEVRSKLGDRPISVNSWYRDPDSNREVGGARNSRHLAGDAVDFVVAGLSSYAVYAKLKGWWGSRGGLASSSIFTHIDARGYVARWSYGY